jgi:hypothetical protein
MFGYLDSWELKKTGLQVHSMGEAAVRQGCHLTAADIQNHGPAKFDTT